MIQLAPMGAILSPISIRQVAGRLTWLDPTAPEFEGLFTEHMRRLFRHLTT
jgi:hypothetical protein